MLKTVEDKDMYITCVNFGLGAGTTFPLEIATVENKKMFLHLWLEAVDSSSNVYKLNYTIYIEN